MIRDLALYPGLSTAWLAASGVGTYFVYSALLPGFPHRWAVVLVVVSAAAFLGALACDKLESLAAFASSIGITAGAIGPDPFGEMWRELQNNRQEIADMKAAMSRMADEFKVEKEKREQLSEELGVLRAKLRKKETVTVREVTGSALALIGIITVTLSALIGFTTTA
jgi:hypothetical protein